MKQVMKKDKNFIIFFMAVILAFGVILWAHAANVTSPGSGNVNGTAITPTSVTATGNITSDGTVSGVTISGTTYVGLPLDREFPLFSYDFSDSSVPVPLVGAALSSGTNSPAESGYVTKNHLGVRLLKSSTTTGSGYDVKTSSVSRLIGGGEVFEAIIAPRITNATIRAGYYDSGVTQTLPTDACYFLISSDGTAQGINYASGVSTASGTSYVMTSNTWYRIQVAVDESATSVTYYIYNSATGALLWSNSVMTNIPTAVGQETGFGITAWGGVGSAIGLVHVDYIATWVSTKRIR